MSEDREAFVPLAQGSRPEVLLPADAAVQERIKELEGQLDKLLKLWTAQTSTVRVEPGGALLIGGVGRLEHGDLEALLPAVEALREATGVGRVWLFEGDIDVRAATQAEVQDLSFSPGIPDTPTEG